MSSLSQKLSLLVEAGALTADDVLQYALYPGRLLSPQEKAELTAIVRDLTDIVPVGRSDAEEYVINAPGSAEWEASFGAGLVRKGALGLATESDMNETHEGPYFSLYHPVEVNPTLRHFANQMNTKTSLLRPTTMRNPSKPMFLTPGIDSDVMGAQTSAHIKGINDQQANIDDHPTFGSKEPQ